MKILVVKKTADHKGLLVAADSSEPAVVVTASSGDELRSQMECRGIKGRHFDVAFVIGDCTDDQDGIGDAIKKFVKVVEG